MKKMDKLADVLTEVVLDGLSINIYSMLIQLLATLFLFLIIGKLVYKPMMKLLNERKEMVDNEIEEAKTANAEAAVLKRKTLSDLESAKAKSEEIVSEAKRKANQKSEEIINKAKEEAQYKLTQAEATLEKEVEAARLQLQKELLEQSVAVASKVIEGAVDEQKHHELIDEAINEVLS